MIRHLLVVCLAGAAASCATSHASKVGVNDAARTPTTQFSVALTHSPDEIQLAPCTRPACRPPRRPRSPIWPIAGATRATVP